LHAGDQPAGPRLAALQPAGELVEDGDAEALGRAAAQLCAEPERARLAGLERSKAFSWRKAAKQTIAVYESLLNKGSRSS